MSHTMWACHLYPVAAEMLPEVQGVVYKKIKLLVNLQIIFL